MYKFANRIVPEILHSHNITISRKTPVFHTFSASLIESSSISGIIRQYLSTFGITYSGSATHLRKAAATLTSHIDPSMQELMSDFLCHSRVCHDQSYKIQSGNPNFPNAFLALESFQSNPDGETHRLTSTSTSRMFTSSPEIPCNFSDTTFHIESAPTRSEITISPIADGVSSGEKTINDFSANSQIPCPLLISCRSSTPNSSKTYKPFPHMTETVTHRNLSPKRLFPVNNNDTVAGEMRFA